MIQINTDIKYNEIFFLNYSDIDDVYFNSPTVYSTTILDDINYDINIKSNITCDKLIIYCDNFENKNDSNNILIEELANIYSFTLILRAKNIKSKQINVLLRKEKIKKLFGL